ncbi:DUF6892 domain-containing protein [Arthrobacter alpinus]|uniref:DUF6892 domain-containing protein n=1 Tax=Arthrobacter alpinus TaxID=656366 RepID=UPI001114F017|nr:hypothetical protein [Arthrobacter alpinus]
MVEPALKESDAHGNLPKTRVIWDTSGVMVWVNGSAQVTEISVRLAEDPEWESRVKWDFAEHSPRGVFSGVFTVAGKSPLDGIPEEKLRAAYLFLKRRTGNWNVSFALTDAVQRLPGATDWRDRVAKTEAAGTVPPLLTSLAPFREVTMYFKPIPKPSGKWKIPAATEPVLTLPKLPFRLAVIQELMFEQDELKPRFDVNDFAADQGARSFDPHTFYDSPIPAVRTWFRRIPIPARLAERVQKLTFDGGNDIYLQLIPQWDGEDEQFFITTLSDEELDQFPNLRTVEDPAEFLSPSVRRKLESRGIVVDGLND